MSFLLIDLGNIFFILFCLIIYEKDKNLTHFYLHETKTGTGGGWRRGWGLGEQEAAPQLLGNDTSLLLA